MAWTELKAADGHVLDAYCARPAAAPTGAIVILQEIFGVNSHVRALCDRYAAQGYLTVAPALFDRVAKSQEMGYDAAGVARGREVKARVSDGQALLDVQAAIDWAGSQAAPIPALPQRGREQGKDSLPLWRRAGVGAVPVAVVGFCWGGTLAWLSAARLAGLSAAVAYYGTGIAAHVAEAPRVPVLLHFGEQDANIPPDHVDKIEQAWPQLPLYRYPAGHGFNCDDRPAYHRPSAERAAARTRQFLEDIFKC